MSNHIIPAARKLAATITPAEATLADAVAANCRLTLSIIETRQTMKLPPRSGHAAYMKAAGVAALLSQAMDQTFSCHELLNEERDQLGLDPRAVGCVPGCFDEPEKRVFPSGA